MYFGSSKGHDENQNNPQVRGAACKAESLFLRKEPMKPEREIDKPYRAWIATLPCLVCSKPSIPGVQDTIPHHLNKKGGGGKGTKCSDRRCIPLCHTHHESIHKDGRQTFCDRWSMYPEIVIARLNEIYIERNG